MHELAQWHNNIIGQRVVEALIKHNFSAYYFKDRREAVGQIMQLIPPGATVGLGGSRTGMELGLWELLAGRGHEIFNHVFLTGANAITLTGEIVNRDAFGNRVAAMMFGPKKVIIIAGTNKIVRDVEEADKRIKLYAAPMNVKRYEMKNPCLKTGECVDCNSPTRACNITTILSRQPPLTEIHVVILGEDLGF